MTFSAAVLTDIHGNAAALEAVLGDLARRSPDRIVLGGDLLANGPRPREVLDRLTAAGYPGVRGNMDDAVVEADDEVTAWAGRQIGAAGLAYLRGLPLCLRITPPGGGSPADDLLVVHSTPRSNNDLLILMMQPGTTSFKTLTPPAEAAAMLAGTRAKRMVYGHIHYFSSGCPAGLPTASIGSVGFPFDGDPRAAYGWVTWDGTQWTVEPVRVEYDHERVAVDLEQSDLPLRRRYAAMIRQAAWLPRGPFQGAG